MKTKRNDNSIMLGCFTPPVMIATFLLEISLAIYTLFRYKWNTMTRLAVAMLVFLALFQLAEYSICRDLGFSSEIWSKIGFVSITALPPLGVHMIAVTVKKVNRTLPILAYASGVIGVFIFLVTDALTGIGCGGNHVIFQIEAGFSVAYSTYYYFWLVAGVALAMYYSKKMTDKHRKRVLNWGVIGYSSFMLPTALLTIANPSLIDGVPSIMCGFAVLLALILVFAVLPNYQKIQDS